MVRHNRRRWHIRPASSAAAELESRQSRRAFGLESRSPLGRQILRHPPPRLRPPRRLLCPALLALLALAAPGQLWAAQGGEPTRARHVWGQFEPQTWVLLREVRETLDGDGNVTGVSVTDSKKTLHAADDESYVLRTESSTEVSGKTILNQDTSDPRRYDGQPLGQTAEIAWQDGQSVEIDGVRYPCRSRETEVAGEAKRATTRLLYCEDRYPYVLWRQTSTIDKVSGQQLAVQTREVLALDMPWQFGSRTFSTAHCKEISRHEMGASVTLIVSSPDVPGGIVTQTSKDLDAEGRLVCRTTTELVEYHIEPRVPDESLRPGELFRRLRILLPGGLGPHGFQPAEPRLPWCPPWERSFERRERPGICRRPLR